MNTPSTKPQERQSRVGTSSSNHEEMRILEDLMTYCENYARQRPQTMALICLGVGFVLGWKLKPW